MRNGPNNTTPRHYSGQFRYPRTFNRRPQFFPNHSYPPNNYFSRPRQQIIFHHHIYHNTPFEQPNRSPLLNNNNNQRPNIPTPNVGVEENTNTPPQNQQTVSPLRRIVTDQYPQIVIRIPLGQIPEHARTFTDDEPETVLTQQGLSRGDIDSIESYSYESKKVVRCCICLEDFKEGDNIRVLWCQHEYHAPCVDTWLHQTPTCPVCRKSAPGRETN